jgi:putative phosphoribosyl transferase
MTSPSAAPRRDSLYPTRAAAGAMLGQQISARGHIGCMLLGITPEGVEIAANAAKAMGGQFDVLVAAFIRLASNVPPVGAIAEQVPSEMDPDFQPGMSIIDKLSEAIDESRARVSQDLVLYRTQRPVKTLKGKVAVIVDGQVIWPWRVLAAAKAAEQLGAQRIVIATPVATQAAAERIYARRMELVCPTIVMDKSGHPSPYGDASGETPERLRAIMIAHQAA